jgi:hypothetical protein
MYGATTCNRARLSPSFGTNGVNELAQKVPVDHDAVCSKAFCDILRGHRMVNGN